MQRVGVSLQKSGGHWQVEYQSSQGQRRWKSLAYLGPKGTVSKRRAQAEADEIAAALGLDPRLRDRKRAPILSTWIDEYIDNRAAEVAHKTKLAYESTGSYLLEHFGPDVKCSSINPEGVDKWRASLLRSGLADETVRGHCRRAYTMFKPLVRNNRIASNPFEHTPRTSKAVAVHGDVEEWMIAKMIDACPSSGWRALVALTCLAGLRRSESMSLKWRDIRFGQGKIVVTNHKTAKSTGKRRRDVLMEKELEAVLLECHEQAAEGAELACDIGNADLDRGMRVIIDNAGLDSYPKPYHSWRSWRSKSWKERYPGYMVDSWLGHSADVARKHYNTIDESVYTGESEIARLRRENEELRQTAANLRQMLEAAGIETP